MTKKILLFVIKKELIMNFENITETNLVKVLNLDKVEFFVFSVGKKNSLTKQNISFKNVKDFFLYLLIKLNNKWNLK